MAVMPAPLSGPFARPPWLNALDFARCGYDGSHINQPWLTMPPPPSVLPVSSPVSEPMAMFEPWSTPSYGLGPQPGLSAFSHLGGVGALPWPREWGAPRGIGQAESLLGLARSNAGDAATAFGVDPNALAQLVSDAAPGFAAVVNQKPEDVVVWTLQLMALIPKPAVPLGAYIAISAAGGNDVIHALRWFKSNVLRTSALDMVVAAVSLLTTNPPGPGTSFTTLAVWLAGKATIEALGQLADGYRPTREEILDLIGLSSAAVASPQIRLGVLGDAQRSIDEARKVETIFGDFSDYIMDQCAGGDVRSCLVSMGEQTSIPRDLNPQSLQAMLNASVFGMGKAKEMTANYGGAPDKMVSAYRATHLDEIVGRRNYAEWSNVLEAMRKRENRGELPAGTTDETLALIEEIATNGYVELLHDHAKTLGKVTFGRLIHSHPPDLAGNVKLAFRKAA